MKLLTNREATRQKDYLVHIEDNLSWVIEHMETDPIPELPRLIRHLKMVLSDLQTRDFK